MNNQAKSYGNKFIRTGIVTFGLCVWWALRNWADINPLWYLPLAAVSMAAIYLGISSGKKLRQKLESQPTDTSEIPQHSSQYHWVMFILTGIMLAGMLVARNYDVGRQFIFVSWAVVYSGWLYYEVKRINTFLKS